ncbi:MAG: tetratricopeptide repeat protein [Flavobacteriales bacterium]
MSSIRTTLLFTLLGFAVQAQNNQITQLLNEGKLNEQKGDFITAQEEYSMALSVDSFNVEAHVLLGRLYHKTDRYDKALEELNTALSYDATNADAFFIRANINTDMGLNASALSDYTRAIQLDPNMMEAYLSRGFIYAEMQYFQEATRDFSIAIQVDHDGAIAYYNFMRVQGVDVLEKNCSYVSNIKANDMQADIVYNTFCF